MGIPGIAGRERVANHGVPCKRGPYFPKIVPPFSRRWAPGDQGGRVCVLQQYTVRLYCYGSAGATQMCGSPAKMAAFQRYAHATPRRATPEPAPSRLCSTVGYRRAVKVGAIMRLKGPGGLEAGCFSRKLPSAMGGTPLTMGGQDRPGSPPTVAPYTVLRTEQPALVRV